MTTRQQLWGVALICGGLLSGCTASRKLPDDALRLPESSLEIRSLQSHTFAAPSEAIILAASIAVLQDMEYNIDTIERPLGIITASKLADADSHAEQAGLVLLDILCMLGGSDCGALSTASDEQLIMLTLVVLPSLANREEYVARVTLQRVVRDRMDRIKVRESIDEPEEYQQIFARLSKSIFLQVNQ
jgi:hypothetical protein